MQVILGQTTADDIVARWKNLSDQVQVAHGQMTGAIIATAGTETEMVARFALARMTVRKAMGKV